MKGWKKFEIYMDRALKACEALIVISLTVVLLGFVVYQIVWIMAGCVQERINSTFKMLNDYWKVGLLLLVPLFYRTVRMFLEKVRKFLGMETRDPDQERVEANPKPGKSDQPQAQPKTEEED